MMARTAVIRVDASENIGGGHVMRCLSLADALIDEGFACSFATSEESIKTVPVLKTCRLTEISGDADTEPAVLMEHWPDGVDLLVVDHYARGIEFERACGEWAGCMLAIDDIPERRHHTQALLDQTVGRCPGEYDAVVAPGTRVLAGSSFALLRRQFFEHRERTLCRRSTSSAVPQLLVSMGGSDPADVSGRVLAGLDMLEGPLAVDLIIGRVWPARERLLEQAMASRHQVEVHEDVTQMAPLMSRADLAIGACGSMSWERCAMGLPSLAISTAENQRDIGRELAERDAARVLGWHTDVDPQAVARAVTEMLQSPSGLARMSRAAREICDGEGARRVAQVLREMVA